MSTLAVPATAAGAPGGLPRSQSSHHMYSPSLGALSSYKSDAGILSKSPPAGSPHSASGHGLHSSISVDRAPPHLRQSSSVHFSHHDDHAHHSHYPCSATDYDVLEEIGVGAFATVYEAIVKETREHVAIKVIDLEQFSTNWDEIRREIMIMSLVHHPNVVRILASFVEGQDLWIVMPLLEAGSCAAIMKQIYPNGMKDEALIATILK
jgi:hypothetical protein